MLAHVPWASILNTSYLVANRRGSAAAIPGCARQPPTSEIGAKKRFAPQITGTGSCEDGFYPILDAELAKD